MIDADHLMTVFSAALDFVSGSERFAYLDRACAGNPELRAGVEELLRAHDEAGKFLEPEPEHIRPTPSPHDSSAATLVPGPNPAAGTVVGGRYRLEEAIGEGGMGTVWRAEQTEPVRREVALKLIKSGMDTRQVVARFEAERQALALMDHPNIAKVFDGGTTAEGRPFFVMELVRGVPVTAFCDGVQLPIRERLELFVDVCHAVQHAHQKGVIHRDLKPSNVLVARYEDRPVPKVIDFGIATATSQSLTEKTLFSGLAGLAGTPEYMSPEQAGLANGDIDTRSDVYSLGVLLYELLTGTTPLTGRRSKETPLLEVLRWVREEEPPNPSMRLSALVNIAVVATNRGQEPRRLNRLICGDLDWIVMKALEKDRNRRYDTAAALAADVRHHLANEPVQAVPPTRGYRLRKFARRHRLTIATAATVAGSLVIAVGALSAGLIIVDRKQQTTQSALHAETLAKEELATSLQRERAARGEVLVSLAQQHWLVGDLGNAVHYLERCPSHLRGRDWRYLHRVCHARVLSVAGGVRLRTTYSPVAVSHDGKLLGASSRGRPLIVWDAATGEERTQPPPPAKSPLAGIWIGTTIDSRPPSAFLMNGLPTFTLNRERVILAGCYTAIPHTGATGPSFVIDFWEPAANKDIQRVQWTGPVGARSVTASPNGIQLAAEFSNRGVALLDLMTGQEVRTLGRDQTIRSVAYSASGHRLAGYCKGDSCIHVWDTATGQLAGTIQGVPPSPARLVLSHDGRLVAALTFGDDTTPGAVRVWSLETARELFHVSNRPTVCGAFSPDGRHLAIGGGTNDTSVTVLDATTGGTGLVFRGFHPVPVNGLVFSPDARRLVSSGPDGTVNILDATPFEEVADPGDVNAGR